MTFEELYEKIAPLWPPEIDISDGRQHEGYLFKRLSQAYAEIENSIDHKNDHWANIGAWSFYQAFMAQALELRAQGETQLFLEKVSKSLIDVQIRKSLDAEGWENEKRNYQGIKSA